MKKSYILLLAALSLSFCLQAQSEIYFEFYKDGKLLREMKSSEVDSIVVLATPGSVDPDPDPDPDPVDPDEPGLDYAVDLGLSVLWADHNVGATIPAEFGDLIRWGESIPREYAGYEYPDDPNRPDDIIGTQYDAATVNWGEKWRMPSRDEFQELVDRCTWEVCQVLGLELGVQKFIYGYKVTGPSGKSIFLPAGGYIDTGISKKNEEGAYWTGNTSYVGAEAFYLTFKAPFLPEYGTYAVSDAPVTFKSFAMSVRPVSGPTKPVAPNFPPMPEVVATPASHAVDLGLSIAWADYNIGATQPEDYGNYYAWGEYAPKKEYYEYSYFRAPDRPDEIIGTKFDAATANWGSDWRMPTKEELEELGDKCSWQWCNSNGVNGFRVTGPSGNSIFLPAGSHCGSAGLDPDLLGYHGYYWSGTPTDAEYYDAYYLAFSASGSFGAAPAPTVVEARPLGFGGPSVNVTDYDGIKYLGKLVRAVYAPSKKQ